jgi:hypothetical protein
LENRVTKHISSGVRQITAVVMILFGSVLALNASAGPCGGTALAEEPFPAIILCIGGLGLILCSYVLVKTLKVESDFRVIIYLFLGCWSLTLLSAVVWLVRSGLPHTQADLNDFYFSLLRGGAAVVNLLVFYKWAGTKNMITRIW